MPTPWERRAAARGGGQPVMIAPPSPKLPVDIRQGNASASSSEASAGRTTALTPLEVRNMDLKNQQMQRELGQSPLSPADQQFLNAMRTQQGDMGDTIRTLGNAAHALDRLNPGPMRATALSAAIPEEGHVLAGERERAVGRRDSPRPGERGGLAGEGERTACGGDTNAARQGGGLTR